MPHVAAAVHDIAEHDGRQVGALAIQTGAGLPSVGESRTGVKQ
jgi:hypothetical protein